MVAQSAKNRPIWSHWLHTYMFLKNLLKSHWTRVSSHDPPPNEQLPMQYSWYVRAKVLTLKASKMLQSSKHLLAQNFFFIRKKFFWEKIGNFLNEFWDQVCKLNRYWISLRKRFKQTYGRTEWRKKEEKPTREIQGQSEG